MQTQETTAKNFHSEEPNIKKAKLTLIRATEASEPSKQARKKKKKKKHPEKQDKEQSSASTVNAIKAQQKKKKKNQDCDVNNVTFLNCDKKDYYASTYIKPLKKLVLVSTTSMPVTNGSKKVVRMPYIHYPVWF